MIDLTDRKNCFYWQTDRNLKVEDFDSYFLRRHELSDFEIKNILNKGIKSIDNIDNIEIINPSESILKGNVNIVRKIKLNNDLYVARMHPRGIKNGYFFVEKLALDAAKNNILVPNVIEIHEADNESDMDFMLMTAIDGITMDLAIKENPSLEETLLDQAGYIMANIHKIKVDGYGSFDNEVAKQENRLIGLHSNYQEFIWCGLEENLQRLITFKVIDEEQSKKLIDIFKKYNFEPIDGPRLIHNDFADWNILVEGDYISGILDWDECHGGDPIADLACWSTFFDIERFEKFINGYCKAVQLPNDFDLRFHYYRLRFTISKMALRVKRALVDHSDFVKDKIRVGKIALAEEMDWFTTKM